MDAFKKALDQFTAPAPGNSEKGGFLDNKGYSNLINENHFNRVKKLLETTQGHIAFGGNSDPTTRRMEMTVVTDVDLEDPLMQSDFTV